MVPLAMGILSYVAAGEIREGETFPEHLIVGGESHEGAVDSPEDDPNIALICLAPEMAEAILEWAAPVDHSYTQDVTQIVLKFEELAMKLRRIGVGR